MEDPNKTQEPNKDQEPNKEPQTTNEDRLKAVQAKYDELSAKVAQWQQTAHNQKIRAEKSESELKALKTSLNTSDPSEAVSELKQRLQIEQEKCQKLESRVSKAMDVKREADISEALLQTAELRSDLIPLMKSAIAVKTKVVEGKTVVITEDGTPRISAKTNDYMTVKELIDEMSTTHKSLLKATNTSGTGASGNTSSSKQVTMASYLKMTGTERSKYREGLSPDDRAAFLAKLRLEASK